MTLNDLELRCSNFRRILQDLADLGDKPTIAKGMKIDARIVNDSVVSH